MHFEGTALKDRKLTTKVQKCAQQVPDFSKASIIFRMYRDCFLLLFSFANVIFVLEFRELKIFKSTLEIGCIKNAGSAILL